MAPTPSGHTVEYPGSPTVGNLACGHLTDADNRLRFLHHARPASDISQRVRNAAHAADPIHPRPAPDDECGGRLRPPHLRTLSSEEEVDQLLTVAPRYGLFEGLWERRSWDHHMTSVREQMFASRPEVHVLVLRVKRKRFVRR